MKDDDFLSLICFIYRECEFYALTFLQFLTNGNVIYAKNGMTFHRLCIGGILFGFLRHLIYGYCCALIQFAFNRNASRLILYCFYDRF